MEVRVKPYGGGSGGEGGREGLHWQHHNTAKADGDPAVPQEESVRDGQKSVKERGVVTGWKDLGKKGKRFIERRSDVVHTLLKVMSTN
ncbi:hypothetical protein Pcinc_029206 [Petrolisthes cinctipes]|uniref:Uncharacterized protein n=1 Tax=Petrolisthes cinctipes TaxID=88211 RepID=A0AAE1K7W3_PETCI|nr:hypothetical protein Pcinc_029206 [Petrolisthes cinctipes]